MFLAARRETARDAPVDAALPGGRAHGRAQAGRSTIREPHVSPCPVRRRSSVTGRGR